MYNIILDRLPTEYKGYLIRTSFRIGIQICLCLDDPDYTDEEKAGIVLDLLYGAGVPHDPDVAVDGLKWFMSGGSSAKKNGSASDKKVFYWDFDSSRIYSSFKQTYGIDLAKHDMHWFEFTSLMGSLDKDSALSKAIEIRTYDMKDLKGKNRAEMQKLKNDLQPPVQLSAEEQEALDQFNALFDGGDVNG